MTRDRLIQAHAIYDMHVQEGPLWLRRSLSKMAGWRLQRGNYTFPIEQKLFDLYVRSTGQAQPGDNSQEYEQLQPETHAQLSCK